MEEGAHGRRCAPGEGIESLARESGLSLNSALILSKWPCPPRGVGLDPSDNP